MMSNARARPRNCPQLCRLCVLARSRRSLVEFDAKTMPVLEHYRKHGVLVDFDVKKGVKDMPRLLRALGYKGKEAQE